MKCLFCLKNKKNMDIKSLLNIKNNHGKIIYSFFKYEKKYSIDDSVISKKRFKNENNLDYIKLSEKIEIIEENAFENCENLTNIVLPENLISIGNYAFSGCANMTSITLPENINSIGDCVFKECPTFSNIYIHPLFHII